MGNRCQDTTTHYLTLCQICILLFRANPQPETASGSIIMQNNWMKLFLKGNQKHTEIILEVFF